MIEQLHELSTASRPQILPRDTCVAFVTNFAPHYRIKMFEALSGMCSLRCYFHSDGKEWYWPREQAIHGGDFPHTYLPGFRLGPMRISPRLATALLFGRHDVIIKCINDRFAVPVTYLAARLRGIPFVLWTGIWCRLTTPAQRLLFPLTLWLYRHADAIVAYGEHVRRYLVSEGVGADRIFLAPQAVDNSYYRRRASDSSRESRRKQIGVPEESKLLLYVGRLEPSKGLECLLDAFARSTCENRALVLCGAGALHAGLHRRCNDLGVADRVFFAGFACPADTLSLYSAACAVVLPSVTTPAGREPWGLVVNEAFNQGVPVIASEAVGAVAGGLVRHLRNGIVVPERDTSALSAAIDRILADGELRNQMGENARHDVADWTQFRMAEGFRDAVSYALARRQWSRQ